MRIPQLFLVCCLMTLFSMVATATENPTRTSIEGVYENTIAADNSSISKVIITCEDGKYKIQAFAKCGTGECDWKTQPLKRESNGTYTAQFQQGFAVKKLIITSENQKLNVKLIRTYTDGRPTNEIDTQMKMIKEGKPCS